MSTFVPLASVTNRDKITSKDRSPVGTTAVTGPKPDGGGPSAPPATSIAWSGVTGTPTDLAGYGITDALNTTTPQDAHTVLAGPASGSPAAPTFRQVNAEEVPYDHTASGLAANDVQAAIDEVAASSGGGGGGTSVTSLKCAQAQRLTIPPDTWVSLASLSGTGSIHKLWLALEAYGGLFARNGRLKIEFNGVTPAQFGGAGGIRLQNLFGPGIDSTTIFRTPRLGVTRNPNTSFSAFLRAPMPYTSGADVKLRFNSPTTTSIRNGSIAMNGTVDTILTTPDAAGNSPTGDIEWVFDLSVASWTTHQTIVSKWDSTINQRSFGFEIDSSGKLLLFWSTTGADTLYELSTVATGFAAGSRHKIKGTLDVDNGLGGYTVSFYEEIAGVWTAIGSPVVRTAGTTSVFNGTPVVTVGAGDNGTTWFVTGTLWEVTLRNGIGGTVIMTLNPSTQPDETAKWTSTTGEVWSIHGVLTSNLQAWAMVEYADAALPLGDMFIATDYVLHAIEVADSVANVAEQTILDVTADVVFLGFIHRFFPVGSSTDFNYLEGDYRIYFNGEGTASYRASGTEDMFDSSYFFSEGVFYGESSGLFLKDLFNGSLSAYKFFFSCPPRDASRLKFTWKNGDPGYNEPGYNVVSNVTAFYYSR